MSAREFGCWSCGANIEDGFECTECKLKKIYGYQRSEPLQTATVKRVNLFGEVVDTFRTETELNGWVATQGKML